MHELSSPVNSDKHRQPVGYFTLLNEVNELSDNKAIIVLRERELVHQN